MTCEEMLTKLNIFSLDNKETTICTSMVFCGSSKKHMQTVWNAFLRYELEIRLG